MSDSDDGSQHDGSYGSVHDYSSSDDIDSEHEEEDTHSDRKQTLLALLKQMEDLIQDM